MFSEVSALKEFSVQAFTARQSFYEKLVLLDGATLTLLFTAVGGLSRANLATAALARVSEILFIGCWLFIVSIVLSLLHNYVNIATLIHMNSSATRLTLHGRRVLLRDAFRRSGTASPLDNLPSADPEADKDLKKGTTTETLTRWFGIAAQACTTFGYVAFVASLQTVIQALTNSAH